MVELWLAFGILYYVGIGDVPPYRIIQNGPFITHEECVKKVHKDVDRIRKTYSQRNYKLIDMYCIKVGSDDSVLDLSTET